MLKHAERLAKSKLPPGWPVRMELEFFFGALLAAFVWSLACPINLWNARSNLYYRTPSGRLMQRTDTVVPSFESLLDASLWGFWILALALLGFVLMHYLYYRRDAKSIYLMRRLPDKGLLHRQCLTVPFWMILTVLVLGLVLLGLYNWIYQTAVLPESVLQGMGQTVPLAGRAQ